MRSLISLVLYSALALAFSLVAAGCNTDNGGGDDDDASWGENIEGTYDAVMTIDVDECAAENEDTTADWLIEISQSKDLSTATVRYKETGPGDWTDLFQGTVYGTVILKAGVVTNTAGQNCTKVSVQDYNVQVDLENTAISGRLSTNIFYMGNGCDSSNIDCFFERTLSSSD